MIAERHKFWTALQEESEAVCDFIVRVQKLARTCGFGGFLQEALRDRLVSGLHPKMKKTHCHLLAMRDLSFQTAKDKCVADELAMKANDLYIGAAAKGDAGGELTEEGRIVAMGRHIVGRHIVKEGRRRARNLFPAVVGRDTRVETAE